MSNILLKLNFLKQIHPNSICKHDAGVFFDWFEKFFEGGIHEIGGRFLRKTIS